jgi:hypothetical protein
VFPYSHGPLRYAPLEFAMKYAGYRFQSASLNSSLNQDPHVFWFNADDGWYWDTARTPEAAKALQVLCAVLLTPVNGNRILALAQMA